MAAEQKKHVKMHKMFIQNLFSDTIEINFMNVFRMIPVFCKNIKRTNFLPFIILFNYLFYLSIVVLDEINL